MALPYLNIHTHNRLKIEDAVDVQCLSAEEILSETSYFYSSAGVHPWWLEDYTMEEIEQLQYKIEKMATGQKLWAIGETGIDRAYPEFLDDQLRLFAWHIDLAEKFQLPLVIHSVRAGSDILQLIKNKKPQTPWIFHDFRGNEELVKDLLRLHPECFFSFGLSIDNSQHVRELLPMIPLERIFFETDAQKHLDIHDIYLRASECLGMEIELLKSQVWLNFKKIEKKHLV